MCYAIRDFLFVSYSEVAGQKTAERVDSQTDLPRLVVVELDLDSSLGAASCKLIRR